VGKCFTYAAPAFTTLTSSPNIFITYEVGQAVTNLTPTLTFNLSNGSNANANAGSTQSTTIAGASFGTRTYVAGASSGTIQFSVPGGTKLNSADTMTVTVSGGTNTNSGPITGSAIGTITWSHRTYWGFSTLASITSKNDLNSSSPESTFPTLTAVRSPATVTGPSSNSSYFYYLYPASDVTGITQGCLATGSAACTQAMSAAFWTTPTTLSITNSYGLPITYNVYRSVDSFNILGSGSNYFGAQ
jgi:hypothetical protein